MTLVIAGIEKFFAGTAVLKDVSLSIEDGEFLTLVGPKASGKSTLLRILAGHETPDVGSVEMVGDTERLRPDLRLVSSKNLVAAATVRENLEAPLRERDLSWFQKLPKVGSFIAPDVHWSIASKVQSAAETLQIDSLLGRRAGELSESQKQRVAIAQALVCDPVACLFDDPFCDLDSETRSRLRAELFELHHMLGVTMIYATNDPSEALKMPDRLAVMLEGRIVQVGPPDAVYDDPDTLAVAQYIAVPSINLFPGELSACGQLSVFGRVLARYRNAIAKPVIVGMRPEAITLSAASKNRLTGRACHSERIGTKTYVQVEVAGQNFHVSAANPPRRQSICVGETVSLAIDPETLLLFEGDGARLRLPMLQWHSETTAEDNPILSNSLVTSRSLQ